MTTFGLNGIQGGVCMAIKDVWTPFIKSKYVLVPGRAQCLIVWMYDQDVGILNLYAPDNASARAVFWDHLYNGFPFADQ